MNSGATAPFPSRARITLEEPLDTPHDDRRAMVQDTTGNIFQIAHRLPGASVT
jgi:hypothetical protein